MKNSIESVYHGEFSGDGRRARVYCKPCREWHLLSNLNRKNLACPACGISLENGYSNYIGKIKQLEAV